MEMWQAQREVEAAARSLQLSNAARRATLGRVGGDAADALRQVRGAGWGWCLEGWGGIERVGWC